MLHFALGIVIGVALMTAVGYAKKESDSEKLKPCIQTDNPKPSKGV